MRLIPNALRQRLRRHFGTVSIQDPRPIAASSPYTYYLPSENELLAIAPGDFVKIIVESHPPSLEWGAERMWVIVTAAAGNELTGTLDNHPSDIPQLRHGAEMKFLRSDIIDIDWSETRATSPHASPPRQEYWDRCMVDRCVLDDDARVHYLYREEPDMGNPDDKYPDSGWRIRGDYCDVSDDELDERKAEYIALGKVLNQDDSWLHLIDAPIGSAFIRDWDADTFVPYERGKEPDA